MIDTHCHILPKLDDGPTTLNESLSMAEFYVRDGITHVIATPHCHRYIHLLRDTILPRVEAFNNELRDARIPLIVLPGSEIQIVSTAEFKKEYESGVLCHFGDCNAFTLIEFNWSFDLFPQDAVELIRWLRQKGTQPILAHPERHNYLMKDEAWLDSLVEAGVWLQVTVDSILGNHGTDPEQGSKLLLKRYSNIVLATDAHNMQRCSGLSVGYQWVKEELGKPYCDALLERSRRILQAVTRTDT